MQAYLHWRVMKCPNCNSNLSIELTIHDAKTFKNHKIQTGLLNSKKKLGAPRVIDRQKVIVLRKNGGTLMTIARDMNISHKSVILILKDCRARGLIE